MGRWRITIDGAGCHHNGKREIDADLAAKDFVGELKKQGHNLEAARFEMLGAIRTSDNVYDANAVINDPPHPSNIDLLEATRPKEQRVAGEAHGITQAEFDQATGAGTGG
jgi:hypothetical protein